jgi:8-oxo-dGTP diphosphatase
VRPTRAPRVGSAVFLTDHHGRILLGRRAKEPNRGKWVLPGGKIQPFESIADAARREVFEETGLEADIDAVLDVREIIEMPHEHRLIVFSSARCVGGKLEAASDLEDIRWFTPDDLALLDLSDVVRDVLDDQGWLQRAAA